MAFLGGKRGVFPKVVLGSETSDMTSEGLREIFEGDSVDMCVGKFPLVSMGGPADPSWVRRRGASTPIDASGNFIKSGVADGNPLLICRIQIFPTRLYNAFRICPSFTNPFPYHLFYEKIKFCINGVADRNPFFVCFFVRNIVSACSSASDMHHYFTVQFYTTWLSYIWLKR